MKNFISQTFLIIILLVFASCSHITNFNSVEGKLLNEEHYATINNVDYQSGESETFGIGLTNKIKPKNSGGVTFDYSIFPDISYETSDLYTGSTSVSPANRKLEMNRFSWFSSLRGVMFSPIGTFEINAGVGLSYFDVYSDETETGKIEPTFRYEGSYTIFVTEKIYTGISFTFQESPQSTYSEYYSIIYKLGYTFGKF